MQAWGDALSGGNARAPKAFKRLKTLVAQARLRPVAVCDQSVAIRGCVRCSIPVAVKAGVGRSRVCI